MSIHVVRAFVRLRRVLGVLAAKALPDVAGIPAPGRFRRRRHGPQVPPDGIHAGEAVRQLQGDRKHDREDKHPLEKDTGDPQKALSASIFYEAWRKAEARPAYAKQKKAWKEKYG